MSGSNCCLLTCTQISQEAGKVVWYSHLFKNSPQFVVIHTVKCFGIANKEVYGFLEKVMTNLDSIFGEGNGTPLQYSFLENPMGGRAW